MDHVYLCRPGENEELRYSLRSLEKFVEHDKVVIIGGWPEWVSDKARTVRNVPLGAGGFATTSHLRLACLLGWISDPFVMWHDDMYATAPTDVRLWHNGPLVSRKDRSTWGSGQRATERWLRRRIGGSLGRWQTQLDLLSYELPFELLSYELHVPLLVHKAPMRAALRCLDLIDANYPHKRTIYGNLVSGLIGPGEYMEDCKVTNARARVDGPWLSSAESTFASCVLPRLTMLNEPSRYEA